MKGSTPLELAHVFRRLERASLEIAGYPDFAGKVEFLESCRDDVEQRYQEGTLTFEQRDRLLRILNEESVR